MAVGRENKEIVIEPKPLLHKKSSLNYRMNDRFENQYRQGIHENYLQIPNNKKLRRSCSSRQKKKRKSSISKAEKRKGSIKKRGSFNPKNQKSLLVPTPMVGLPSKI